MLKKIVCLGDSIVYGYGVPRKNCWVRLAAERTGVEMLNRGVSGDTALGMLSRFERDVSNEKPDAVFLMGGANDIAAAGRSDTAKSAMFAMVQRALSEGMRPIVGVPTPIHPPVREDWAILFHTDAFICEYAAYAEWLRTLTRAFGVTAVDFYNGFLQRAARYPGGSDALYEPDGLHPNRAAQQMMADIFCEAVFSDAAGIWETNREEQQ